LQTFENACCDELVSSYDQNVLSMTIDVPRLHHHSVQCLYISLDHTPPAVKFQGFYIRIRLRYFVAVILSRRSSLPQSYMYNEGELDYKANKILILGIVYIVPSNVCGANVHVQHIENLYIPADFFRG